VAQRHQQVGVEQRRGGGAVGHREGIAHCPGVRAHAADVPLDHVAGGAQQRPRLLDAAWVALAGRPAAGR